MEAFLRLRRAKGNMMYYIAGVNPEPLEGKERGGGKGAETHPSQTITVFPTMKSLCSYTRKRVRVCRVLKYLGQIV